MTPERILTRARSQLLLNQPFWGALSMRLKLESDSNVPVAATDGTTLKYNPKWATSAREPHVIAVVAHEVQHCALLHPFRRGTRDPKRWNIACDYAINLDLQKAGFQLPDGCLLGSQYAGMSAEQVYSQLQADAQSAGGPSQPADGATGKPDTPSPTGTVEDAPDPTAKPAAGQPTSVQPQSEVDWQIATEQAAKVAEACGTLPANMARQLQRARESEVDWRAVLWQFVQRTIASDYTWMRPNRRFIHQGLYLPSIECDNVGRLALGVDMSGSVNIPLLSIWLEEVEGVIRTVRPAVTEVICCDSRIHSVQEFTPDEPLDIKPVGGGGTSYRPVFEHLDKGEQPVCLVYFTDLYCHSYPDNPPTYPVLWVAPEHASSEVPFGQVVRIPCA